ncbi:hypothetical protein [Sulfobacillus thermosulfidooxidans]|uniref:hypothetical protein n=1 Tax=Sulfobacillus thermosulfidooxidans TaxID=28034 RepID=UPI0006B5A34B|nr:hypothetical protein [Sulfobacillus thermosulfidooxidans]
MFHPVPDHTSVSSKPSPQPWLVGIDGLLWAAVGLIVGLLWMHVLITRLLARAAQSDVWWSWVLGRWEITHHQVYAYNLPAFNGVQASGPWINLEWGWQALLGWTFPHGLHGWPLTALLWGSGLLLIVSMAALLRLVYQPTMLLPALAVLPWILLAGDWPLRPQILSASFWLILLGLLASSLYHPRRLWAIIPLWLMWSTLHGDWILVPLLLMWQIGWLLWTFWRQGTDTVNTFWAALAKTFGVLVIGATLLTWLNPFHTRLWTTAIHLTGNPLITRVIQEWQSPVWTEPYWTGLALSWALIILLWAAHKVPQGPWMGWWAGTVLATLWHQRMALYNLPLTVLLLASALLPVWPQWGGAPERLMSSAWQQWLRPAIWSFSGGLMLAGLLGLSPLAGPAFDTAYARAMHPPTWPVATWCAQHPTTGLTLTPYRLGGVWEAAGNREVFLDGRTLWWIQHHRLQPYLAWQDGDLPVSALAHFGVTRIVWPTTATTPQTLWLHQAHWHQVYHAEGLTVWQSFRRSSR